VAIIDGPLLYWTARRTGERSRDPVSALASGIGRTTRKPSDPSPIPMDTEEIDRQVEAALEGLRTHASREFLEQMQSRYGIVTEKAFGTPMARIKAVAKPLGRNHELAEALWQTGWYEARLLTSFVDDPAQVTPEQMDRWRADFDNWAVVDTLCFNLFDRTPYALAKVEEWADLPDEFGRRAAFALLASVALHRTDIPDSALHDKLELIAQVSTDGRNFVKKGASWALRAVGGRGGSDLRTAATDLARRLAESDDRTARWIGRDALKSLTK
jgi:3-methyladenine DNA glycosylase AlkD